MRTIRWGQYYPYKNLLLTGGIWRSERTTRLNKGAHGVGQVKRFFPMPRSSTLRSWLKKSVLEKRQLEVGWKRQLEVGVGFVFEVFAAVRELTTQAFGEEQWGRVAKSFFGVICLKYYVKL